MNENLYWPIYKNLERELINLSELIHFDDTQLNVYSVKISELLIRTVVEIESIVKELYFLNGGIKPDDKDLYFDTDCIELIENKWILSKKIVIISATNFYLNLDENRILTPLKKANKRGSSSSDWQKAYQAIKHNRVKNLSKGNLKNFTRALAALFLLNVYYKNDTFDLDNNTTATNFDNSLGSSIFSIKIHKNNGISIDTDYKINEDFVECVYFQKPTDETRITAQQTLREFNNKITDKFNKNLHTELEKHFENKEFSTSQESTEEIKEFADKLRMDYTIQLAKENAMAINNAFSKLKYEGILNKNNFEPD